MFTALIVDDEQDAIGVLRKSLELFCPTISKILEASDGPAAITHLAKEKVDITFLDIRLKRESGLSLYSTISKYCARVVFVTAYDEYAVKAFKTDALHYLLKPIEPAELEKALERAQLTPSRIILNNQGVKEAVLYQDILYLESDGPYTTFYLIDGRAIVMSYTLKHFEGQLQSPTFFRAHRSFLVNLRQVINYSPGKREITMNSQQILPLAKRQVRHFGMAYANVQ